MENVISLLSSVPQENQGGLLLDLSTQRAYVDKKEVHLSTLEFRILLFLYNNADRVLSRDQILDSVWGRNVFVSSRVVDSHIRTIRRKLGFSRIYIESVYGAGYRFKGDSKEQLEDCA